MDFSTFESPDGKVMIVQVPNRLEANISNDFKKMINDLVDNGRYRLVVDMTRTEFMDSSGLGALVSRIAATRSNNGDVRVAAPSPFIINLLEITHLDQVFKCFDDLESAIQSFES